MAPSGSSYRPILVCIGAANPQQGLAWLQTQSALTQPNQTNWLWAVEPHQAHAAAAILNTALDAAEQLPSSPSIGLHRRRLGLGCLTLCIGEMEPLLRDWHGQVQQVWVDVGTLSATSSTCAKLVARQCQLGAPLYFSSQVPAEQWPHWLAAGFVAAEPTSPQLHTATYRPRWPTPPPQGAITRHAIVIGAGLAGAAICHSLTQRGWRIDLLDQAGAPAQGASGLPVGLMSEHHTSQETLLSKLSSTAMPMQWRTLTQCIAQGQGWQATQATRLDGNDDDDANTPNIETQTAALVRPGALVAHWLECAKQTQLLTTHWQCHVQRIDPPCAANPNWQLLGDDGTCIACAPHVILASAFGTAQLLENSDISAYRPTDLRAVRGQMSWGQAQEHANPNEPEHPIRKQGVYVPQYRDSKLKWGAIWAMGSTYERGQQYLDITDASHESNAKSLDQISPQAHLHMQAQWQQGTLQGWAGVRCATPDRMPIVGAMPAPCGDGNNRSRGQLKDIERAYGLWALTGLGSRGLLLSRIMAELLASTMEQEPLPMPKSWAHALDPARFHLKQMRLQHSRSP